MLSCFLLWQEFADVKGSFCFVWACVCASCEVSVLILLKGCIVMRKEGLVLCLKRETSFISACPQLWVVHSRCQSLTNALSHSVVRLLTRSQSHSLTHSFIYSNSHTHLVTDWLTHLFTQSRSLTHSLTHSLIYSHSHTQSVTDWLTDGRTGSRTHSLTHSLICS